MDPKRRKEIEAGKDEALRGFIEAFRFLIRVTYNKNVNDEDFAWYQNAYSIAAKSNPIIIIQKAGPPLWDLREKIENGDINYFLEASFDDSFAKHRDKGVPDEMDHEKQLIKKLRVVFHLFSQPEKEEIRQKFIKAIKCFAEYVRFSKEEKAFE